MKRTLASLGTVAVIICMTASGCATGSSGTIGRHTPMRELTDAEQIQVDQAEQLLVRKCMARHGFPYWVEPALSPEEQRSVGYVVDDLAWVRTYGYGSRIEAKIDERKKRDRNLAYRKTLSEAKLAQYTTALAGGPDTPTLSVELPAGGTITSAVGGCEGEAQRRLYGDRETWFRVESIASNLTPLYVPDLVRDKRFTRALAAWSRCMRRAGHPYSDPEEIRDRLGRLTASLSPDKAQAVEVRLAVAEATCARESKLADTGRKLERHYRDRLRERYGEELTLYSRLQQAALARAKQINGWRP